ncbi:MAG: protoporphyrinogen/coproporphyrinogen oxidase [Bdellovibrionia bacterium]
MIGQIHPQIKEVTVIGGGIAGLLAAYALEKKGYSVDLYESSDRLGGLIQTRSLPQGIAEAAAHSLLVTPAVLEFCESLGVELCAVNPRSKARWILREGQFRQFPLSWGEALAALLRACFLRSKLSVDPGSLTLEQWVLRFLGRPALDYLMTPMLRGIYGARAHEIAVGAAFPALVVPRGRTFLGVQLFRMLSRWMKNQVLAPVRALLQPQSGTQSPDSLRKTRPKKAQMMAPKKGMGELARALERSLRASQRVRIHLNSPVKVLPAVSNLVLAVPASHAAELLQSSSPELSRRLSQVPYTPLISVTVFLKASDFLASKQKSPSCSLGPSPQQVTKFSSDAHPYPSGVGVLFPEKENTQTLGFLFNSSAFPQRVSSSESLISLSAFLGGSSQPSVLDESDEQILRRIEMDLKQFFGFQGQMESYQIHRWPHAVPQYNASLMETWEVAAKTWCQAPGHVLFGNYTGQLSVRGMIERVLSWPLNCNEWGHELEAPFSATPR